MPRKKAGAVAKGSEFPAIPKVPEGKTRAAWTQVHKNAISACVIQNPKLTAKACWEQLGWNATAGKNTVDFPKFESQFKLIKAKEIKKFKDGDATRNKAVANLMGVEVNNDDGESEEEDEDEEQDDDSDSDDVEDLDEIVQEVAGKGKEPLEAKKKSPKQESSQTSGFPKEKKHPMTVIDIESLGADFLAVRDVEERDPMVNCFMDDDRLCILWHQGIKDPIIHMNGLVVTVQSVKFGHDTPVHHVEDVGRHLGIRSMEKFKTAQMDFQKKGYVQDFVCPEGRIWKSPKPGIIETKALHSTLVNGEMVYVNTVVKWKTVLIESEPEPVKTHGVVFSGFSESSM